MCGRSDLRVAHLKSIRLLPGLLCLFHLSSLLYFLTLYVRDVILIIILIVVLIIIITSPLRPPNLSLPPL